VQVKVCGITTIDDAQAAARAGADFIGLILTASVRQVQPAQARAIVSALPGGGPQPVLVFRDAPPALIADTLGEVGVRWAQLHGREPPSSVAELRRLVPDVRVIKAFELGPTLPEAAIRAFLESAERGGGAIDVLLLDRPKAAAAADPRPMHQIMAHFARTIRRRPPQIWCAGGLTPANVAEVVAAGAFDGVDVAGGVERAPGRKDHAAIAAFIAAARVGESLAPP
jgi:phosphoribosylanthranilate isomerase